MKLTNNEKAKIKKIAAEYKDVYVKEGAKAYVARYIHDFTSGPLSHAESFLAQKLSDIYLAFVDGIYTRQEATSKQNALLNGAEVEQGEIVGLKAA